MRFQYFEIRPCVEHDGETRSFLGAAEWHEGIGDRVHTPAGALAEAEQFRRRHSVEAPVFWTLYGRDEDGLAMAVGDFTSFEDALEVMNAILAPMAAARDAAWDAANDRGADTYSPLRCIANDLDDFINQCSNGERL